MRPPAEQLIRDYLNRLSVAARTRLRSEDRRAFLARTRDFIERQSGARGTDDPAAVMRILSGIGEPEAVVEAEYARLEARRSGRPAAGGSGLWKPKPRTEPGTDSTDSAPAENGVASGNASDGFQPQTAKYPSVNHLVGKKLTGEKKKEKPTHRPLSSRWKPGDNLKPPKQARSSRVPLPRTGGSKALGGSTAADGPKALSGPTGASGATGGATGGVGGAARRGGAGGRGGVGGGKSTSRLGRTPPPGATSGAFTGPGADERRSVMPDGPVPAGSAAGGPGPSGASAAAGSSTGSSGGPGPGFAAPGPSFAGPGPGFTGSSGARTGSTRPASAPGPRPGGSSGPEVRPTQVMSPEAATSASEATPTPANMARRVPSISTALVTIKRPRATQRVQPGDVVRNAGAAMIDAWRQHRLESTCVVLMAICGFFYPFPIWVFGFLIWLIGAATAVSSRLWTLPDKWIGLVGPVALVVIGTATALSFGGTRSTGRLYVHEALADSMVLIKIGSLLGAAYLAWRIGQGHRAPAVPSWRRSGRRRIR
jgi:hypothetical protein